MSCLSANAKLVRDEIQVDSSIKEEEIAVQGKLEHEELEASAKIERDKIDIDVSFICSIGKDNSLWASDGVLYDGNSDPLFVTE